MEAKERRKMEEKKRDEYPEGKSGSDLIRRDQIVQLIRKMEKENKEEVPLTYYAACLQGGFESCLISMEKEIKEMNSADEKRGGG